MSTPSLNKSAQNHANSSHLKLFLFILICIGVVIYVVSYQASPERFTIPFASLSGANSTKIQNCKNLQTSLFGEYNKDTIIEALISVSTQKQINKLINYIHYLNLPKYTPPNTQPQPKTNTFYKYQLTPLNSEMFNANSLRNGPANHNQFKKHITGNQQMPNNSEYNQYISLLIQRSPNYKNTVFYKDLQKYKLELRLITLKDKQQFFTHPINNKFFIYPKNRFVEYFRCDNIDEYGNGLSHYWGVRSLAYWMNYNFKINCKGYQNNRNKNKYMSAFLPLSIASNANMAQITDIVNESITAVTFWPKVDPVPNQRSFIHPTSMIFMYYNPYFQRIMNYETNKAMIDYYNYTKKTERIQIMDTMSDTNDIVVHFRCGDILVIMPRITDWDYGFLTMNFYRYVMDIGLKRKFGIDWYTKMTEKTTVWIASQLSKKSAREGEQRAMKDCDFLLNYIVDNGLREIFKPAQVKIMYDSDANDDYYRMLTAPLLFCAPSTFCFNAGIANVKGIVVMPNRGAWLDFFAIDGKNQSYYADQEDYIIGNDSHLIPKNQLIIDTEKSGWHCNEIDNYQFGKASYSQSVYARKLAEYLVAH